MENIADGIHRHRRHLLLVIVGLIILLLHGIVYAQSMSASITMPTDLTDLTSLEDWNRELADQQAPFTRLIAAATVLPLVGQALIIAGLLGWVLQQRPGTSS